MNRISLTQGQFAIVDDEDYLKFSSFKWYAWKCPVTGSFYARRSVGPNKNRKAIVLHRAIMEIDDPKIFVDHINHDTLDCRKSNLRACTPTQNQMNRRGATRKSLSGIRGVTWDKPSNKWKAHIRVRGKLKNLGRFKDIGEAAEARGNASKKYFGVFAGGA